jgi:DNA invertase Pin-like site-specific DNA recombinase
MTYWWPNLLHFFVFPKITVKSEKVALSGPMVTRIDRLARSTFDLFGIVKRIVDAKAQFRSFAEPWADTSTSTGRLMLAVLGGLADVERDLIRTRTAEAEAAPKTGESAWADPLPSPQRRSKRPPDAARRALRCRNWPTATTAAFPPCAA